MANTIEEAVPKLLAMGLLQLREKVPMLALVNTEFEREAGEQGDVITVPYSNQTVAKDVTPSAAQPATDDVTVGSAKIILDRWKYQDFYLTDKERGEIMDGMMPVFASSAIRALANEVNIYLMGLASKFYGFVGTPSVTPFGSIATATDARVVLNEQVADTEDRYFVVNPAAEGNALQLRAFHDASFGVGAGAIREGQIDQRLGFAWFMSQLIQSHVAGSASGFQTNGSHAAGTKVIALDTGTGTFNQGDLVTFAGHTQKYVVTQALTGAGNLNIEPGLVVGVGDNVAVTGPGDTGGITDHVMNMAFQKEAIGFGSKPLARTSHPATVIDTAFDAESGLALRLEVTRQNARDRWCFDILYGADVIRREAGCRVAG